MIQQYEENWEAEWRTSTKMGVKPEFEFRTFLTLCRKNEIKISKTTRRLFEILHYEEGREIPYREGKGWFTLKELTAKIYYPDMFDSEGNLKKGYKINFTRSQYLTVYQIIDKWSSDYLYGLHLVLFPVGNKEIAVRASWKNEDWEEQYRIGGKLDFFYFGTNRKEFMRNIEKRARMTKEERIKEDERYMIDMNCEEFPFPPIEEIYGKLNRQQRILMKNNCSQERYHECKNDNPFCKEKNCLCFTLKGIQHPER